MEPINWQPRKLDAAPPPDEAPGADELPRRSRRLQAIALLPSAATLGNLICGVLAILAALLAMRASMLELEPRYTHPQLLRFFPTYIAAGAYLIVGGMLFDALDGRLARLARRTSEFGAQLDSIADIVTFGTAPSILFVTLLLQRSATAVTPGDEEWLWKFGLLTALVYTACAAIRLARFNAESVKAESSVKTFSGLPSPAAAAVVVALLILHEDLVRTGVAWGAWHWSVAVRWVIGAMLLLLGWLMVSRLDYIHVFNVYVARRKYPPDRLVWILVAIGLLWVWPQGLLVIAAFTYLVSGFVLNIRRRRAAARENSPADASTET